jgi:Flp pilus assembly protein CpaB
MAESSNNGSGSQQSSVVLLIVSLGLALVAVVAVNLYIFHVKREVEGDSFTVYTLTRTIRPGSKLSQADVKPVPMPSKYINTFFGPSGIGAVDKLDFDSKLAKGELFLRAAEQNEFLTHKLFTTDESYKLTTTISPGQRLVFLPINSKMVPGTLAPGMFVDSEARFSKGGAIPDVLTVMERVQVKAVGSKTIADEVDGSGRPRAMGSYQGISIEVSPKEATQLSEIERLAAGEFEIHLRNPIDTLTPKITGTLGINPEVLSMVEKAIHTGSPMPTGVAK